MHAGAPRHLVRVARLPLAAVGLDRDLGGARSRSSCAGPVSRPCSSRTTRTSSRSAARTTTPTSARGTTCAGTREIRGAPTATRATSARPRCRPGAAGGSGATGWDGRPRSDRPYDRSRTFFRAEEDFPGPRTMRTAARWLRHGAPGDAPFLLFVDEFDPARAVRHARALGRALRPGLGRRAADLAALRRRARWPTGRLSERRRPPDPGQLRRQAQHDRPLGWRGVRRAHRARAVGQHGGHRVHRPRALSRREGHLGQAGRHAVRAARPHPAAGALARAAGRYRMRRADDQRRHQRHHRGRVRRRRRRAGAHGASLAPAGAGRGRDGAASGPSAASSATGCR